MKRYVIIFMSIWLYVLLAGLTLQWIVLPLTPFHGGYGLMQGGDWTSFHQMGVELASAIKEQGWGAWQPSYQTQVPASIAAALYVVTGIEMPWVLLPLHGLVWGIAGLVTYSMAKAIGLNHRLALLTVAPLLVFPSTAMVWGQIHKDIFSITGALLLVHYWMWWLQVANGQKALKYFSFTLRLIVLTMAMAMIVYVRPYLGQVAQLASLAAFATGMTLLLAQVAAKRPMRLVNVGRGLLVGLCGLAMLWVVVDWDRRQASSSDSVSEILPPQEARQDDTDKPSGQLKGPAAIPQPTIACPGWQPTKWLPHALDNRVSALACARNGFRSSNPGGSSLDVQIGFNSVKDILSYLPRALQISFFAPFPDSWLAKGVQTGGTMMRLLTIPEMLVLYVSLAGVVLALWQPRLRQPVLVALAFSLTWVLIHTFTVTSIGTLYRMRYPGMFIWIMLGTAGWAAWLQGTRNFGSQNGQG
jgi:hypothetical protein